MKPSHPERSDWGSCCRTGCEKFVAIKKHRLCNEHYRSKLTTESPVTEEGLRNDPKAVEAFWSRVEVDASESACWPWKLTPHSHGHGTFNWKNKAFAAYRVSAILSGRDVPEGYLIDHKCRNRVCVNPKHLQVTTFQANAENIKTRADSPVGVRGVTQRASGVFRARVGVSGKVKHVGDFHNLEDAAHAVKQARLKLHKNNLEDRGYRVESDASL